MSDTIAELNEDELEQVTGGVLGAVPGYTPALPSELFVSGWHCEGSVDNGSFVGRWCINFG